MNAKVALRPVIFVLFLCMSLSYSSGQANQGGGCKVSGTRQCIRFGKNRFDGWTRET
jgi:hypothetical protein